MKETLQRHKTKSHPKIPESIQNLRATFSDRAVLEKYGYNLDGDEKFYIDTVIEKDFAFTVFASKYVIDFVQQNIEPGSRHYIMDGKFDSIPGGFYQLLIITIEFQNDVSI